MGRAVVIVGGAGGAKVAFDIFLARGVAVRGFMDNYVPEGAWGTIEPVLLGAADAEPNADILREDGVDYFVATGDNAMRRDVTRRLVELTGKRPVSAVHPTAVVSEFAAVGDGCLICAGAFVGPGSELRGGAIVNTHAVVEHDNRLGAFAQVSPAAALGGYVSVGERAFVGLGASVIPHVSVGAGAVVAAGAAVINDVEGGTLVAGCPAVFKKHLAGSEVRP
jgi:UDP-perosamine 4-acetyltransferase